MYNLCHFLQKYYLKQRGILQTKNATVSVKGDIIKFFRKKLVYSEEGRRGKKAIPLDPDASESTCNFLLLKKI